MLWEVLSHSPLELSKELHLYAQTSILNHLKAGIKEDAYQVTKRSATGKCFKCNLSLQDPNIFI
jgi:hypothetical protein